VLAVLACSCAPTPHAAQVLSSSSVGVCGSAIEGATVNLSCPTGTVIAAISFASYGSPIGACGAFTAGSCNANNSSSVVSSACLGKSSCSVTANNATFGDPCRGVAKRLYAQVSCSDGGGGGGGGAGGSGGGGGGGGSSGYFPPGAAWYQDISSAPLDSESSTVISWLNSAGFGTGMLQ